MEHGDASLLGMVATVPTETDAVGESAGEDDAERSIDLFVIGDVNFDILGVVDEDAVPSSARSKLVGTIGLTVGGSSAVACGAARLGLRVAHGGIVGDDLLSRAIRDALTEHGVGRRVHHRRGLGPSRPARRSCWAQGLACPADGDGTIDRLAAEDVPRRYCRMADTLHAGSTAIPSPASSGPPDRFARPAEPASAPPSPQLGPGTAVGKTSTT